MSETNIALSIYIPRVFKFHTVESIANICFHAGIGIVHRVDFVAIENTEYYMSMFVHMKQVDSHSYLGNEILSQFDQGKSYKFLVNPNEFWILLKAKNVVPDTHLNVHQLAENHRLLEELVANQASTIASQEEQMTRMKSDIDRLQDTVLRLLGSVFQEKTVYENYNWMKYGNDGAIKEDKQEEKCKGEYSSEDEYADMPDLITPSDDEDYEITTPKFIGRNLVMEFLDSHSYL